MQNLDVKKIRDTSHDAPKGREPEWLLMCALSPYSGRDVLGGTAQKIPKWPSFHKTFSGSCWGHIVVTECCSQSNTEKAGRCEAFSGSVVASTKLSRIAVLRN